jgi:hypothetical protein
VAVILALFFLTGVLVAMTIMTTAKKSEVARERPELQKGEIANFVGRKS